MSIDLNPPTAATPGATPPPPAPPRTSARVIAILAIVTGGALILGAVVSGLASAFWAAGGRDGAGSRVADATGIQTLSVDVSAGDLTVVYADVDEATLEVDGDRRDWRLERRGDELRVENGSPWWVGWRVDWESDRATLTLPEAYETTQLDGRLEVSAGSVTAGGTYGDLEIHVGAGEANVTGTASTLRVDVSAGRADVAVEGVDEGSLTIGAGEIFATLDGAAPRDLTIDVSAGTLVATLPDQSYDVTSDVSAGSLDNELSTSSSSPRTIDVQVAAGSATLRPLP